MSDKLAVEDFRARAQRLRNQAWVILMAIFSLLAGATYIFFVGAANITRGDVDNQPVYRNSEAIQEQIDSIKKNVGERPKLVYPQNITDEYRKLYDESLLIKNDLRKNLVVLNDMIDRRVALGEILELPGSFCLLDYFPFQNTKIIPIDRSSEYNLDFCLETTNREWPSNLYVKKALIYIDFDEIREFINEKKLFYPSIEDRLNTITANIAAANALKSKIDSVHAVKLAEWNKITKADRDELNTLERGLEIVLQNEFEVKFGVKQDLSSAEIEIPTSFLIQTNVTRFGAMIIIIFFVSILVNLYRYSMRLAAYYEARGDILSMIFDNDMYPYRLEILVSAFSPEAYDFGKTPRSPGDQTMQLAKALVTKVK